MLPQYDETPLTKVVEGLSQLAGINIHLDPRGLEQEGVRSDTPITLNLPQEISLKSALTLILEPLHLTYTIKDEVLKITSEQIRDGEVYIKRLPRGRPGDSDSELRADQQHGPAGADQRRLRRDGRRRRTASPGRWRWSPGPTGRQSAGAAADERDGAAVRRRQPERRRDGRRRPMSGGPGGLGGAASADFDSLIDLIVSTVEHDSWMENGTGEGEIQPFPTNLSLVISQTQRVHEQIADLLEQLRRLQDLQVTIEVRFIRLTDSFFERIGVDFDFNIEDGTGLSTQPGCARRAVPGRHLRAAAPQRDAWASRRRRACRLPELHGGPRLAVPAGQLWPVDAAVRHAAADVGTFGFAILSDIEAFFLIDASQGDRRANVLQAPKVTLFNGQQAIVVDTSFVPFVISVIPVVGDFAAAQQPVIVVLSEGTMMTVQAVVSDDRRYVRLTLVPFFSQIGEVREFTFEGSETTSSSSASDRRRRGRQRRGRAKKPRKSRAAARRCSCRRSR